MNKRNIRIFISSTFQDMQEERDVLVKKIFPQLRKMCKERGVGFTEVDLRWGVTKEQAERGEVLPICLAEIENCRRWLDVEFKLLQPELIISVGKLAIGQLMPVKRLNDVVGRLHRVAVSGRQTAVAPLPHPSGASTWHRTGPGSRLLLEALEQIRRHPAWQRLT